MDVKRLLRVPLYYRRVPEIWRCLRRSGDWRFLIGAYLGIEQPRFPHEFATPFGDTITLEDFEETKVAWALFIRDEYRVAPTCRTIVDAGANIGIFSLLAARKAPEARILALEPAPDTRSRFEAAIARNGLSDRVACRPWALGSEDGTQRLGGLARSTVLRGMVGVGVEVVDAVEVETVSLASLWEREDLGPVDLLKMDIEGMEHQVLLGAPSELLRRVAELALEYHPNEPRERLFSHLRAAGFRLVRDVPSSYSGPNSGVAHFRRG